MKLILGKLNRNNTVQYWNAERFENLLGNYAIVENSHDYDLVKIIGVLETNEKYEKLIANGNKLKRVVMIIEEKSISYNVKFIEERKQ